MLAAPKKSELKRFKNQLRRTKNAISDDPSYLPKRLAVKSLHELATLDAEEKYLTAARLLDDRLIHLGIEVNAIAPMLGIALAGIQATSPEMAQKIGRAISYDHDTVTLPVLLERLLPLLSDFDSADRKEAAMITFIVELQKIGMATAPAPTLSTSAPHPAGMAAMGEAVDEDTDSDDAEDDVLEDDYLSIRTRAEQRARLAMTLSAHDDYFQTSPAQSDGAQLRATGGGGRASGAAMPSDPTAEAEAAGFVVL